MSEPDPLGEIFKELCAKEAPLTERLAAFSAAVRQHALPFAEAYDELVTRLEAASTGSSAPGVGDEMPRFALPDANFRFHCLEDLLERGPVVISFNRGHWCEFCAIELASLKQALSEIAAAGAQVVSIMPETKEFVGQVAASNDHAFLVLSDEDNGYALSLNLVMWLGDRVRELFEATGLKLETSQGNDGWFVPIPATFVVGSDGRIIARYVDPDFRRRMEIDDIIAALRSARN